MNVLQEIFLVSGVVFFSVATAAIVGFLTGWLLWVPTR